MKNHLLLILTVASTVAQGNEVEIACNLEHAKVEVQASTLESPAIISSIGQDATNGSKSAFVGLTQSISGRIRAKQLRELGDARCETYKNNLILEEHIRWANVNIEHRAAEAELEFISLAEKLSITHLDFLNQQLENQIITLPQYVSAQLQMVKIQNKKAQLIKTLAMPVPASNLENISQALSQLHAVEARVAFLSAQTQAPSAWDAIVSVGYRQPMQSNVGDTSPFASIAFRWSLGKINSDRAADEVRRQSALLLSHKSGGYADILRREKATLAGLIEAETSNQSNVSNHFNRLQKILNSFSELDTALANVTRQSLNIESKLLEAELAGSQERLNSYKSIQVRLSD